MVSRCWATESCSSRAIRLRSWLSSWRRPASSRRRRTRSDCANSRAWCSATPAWLASVTRIERSVDCTTASRRSPTASTPTSSPCTGIGAATTPPVGVGELVGPVAQVGGIDHHRRLGRQRPARHELEHRLGLAGARHHGPWPRRMTWAGSGPRCSPVNVIAAHGASKWCAAASTTASHRAPGPSGAAHSAAGDPLQRLDGAVQALGVLAPGGVEAGLGRADADQALERLAAVSRRRGRCRGHRPR